MWFFICRACSLTLPVLNFYFTLTCNLETVFSVLWCLPFATIIFFTSISDFIWFNMSFFALAYHVCNVHNKYINRCVRDRPDKRLHPLVDTVYSRYMDSNFPGWCFSWKDVYRKNVSQMVFSQTRHVPERRFPDHHFSFDTREKKGDL